MKGILDRIEDGEKAVILIEEWNKEVIIPKEQLPCGSQLHSWFDLEMKEDHIISITLNQQTTEREQRKTNRLRNKIKSKKQLGSKYKRN
ncbi:DUF3006 domain-containing protein [Aquibacillus sp. 3ASR75-11]|uniref:DUF3006 domain-containing protein n=1 Tax=Terrihalobacillus insolitus TaxID=2950438 RepID=A0A9X3WX73_9BACI|nr:DUF3006 family protein [Terrihalobacillus insolitus]MDC3414999.1 DUF3006 domain-containing protein [Terrihalobacillus insolitus]MDC3425866.1 DUF3006 domain-containing protein [Terrihalobacillus insolitus]